MKKKQSDDQLSLAGTEEGEILARLSERVEKAVQMINELRRERDELEARLESVSTLEEEHERFARERTEIRNRIESILGNLESLDE
ncbi:MAG TPA: cell division protein ZapB [Thermoanaerobaculia bacterium]|nr:cell division protein ZapB [Thermoanaerobaculia bacterium]